MEQDAEVPAHGLLLESVVQSLPLSKGLDNTVARSAPGLIPTPTTPYLSHQSAGHHYFISILNAKILCRLLLVEYLGLGAPSEEHITALNQRLLPLVRLFESK